MARARLRTQFASADDFDPIIHERRSVARTGESEVPTAFRLLELMLRETSSIVSNFETQPCLVEMPNHVDRMAAGGVSPGTSPVGLENHKETGADYFLERRELGVINVGGPGVIHVDGKAFELDHTDCLYVATRSKIVTFQSSDANNRAKFYLLSCPSHAVCCR